MFTTRRTVVLALSLVACGGTSTTKTIDANAIDANTGVCAGSSPQELMACVSKTRLTADLEAISMERVPGSTHWQTIQNLCRDRFTEAGYEIELHAYGTGINVIGRKPGSVPTSGEIILSAHYDHIAGCPGASDNGAGVAVLLEVARLLGDRSNRHPLVVACWDEEETGLIGSRAYSDRAKTANTKISAMFSYDAIGYLSNEPNSQTLPMGFGVLFPDVQSALEANENRGDFVALIADEKSSESLGRIMVYAESIGLKAEALALPDSLKLSPATGSLRPSDHASFWENEYPGLQFSDTANFRNPNYHCQNGSDLPSTLDMNFVTQIAQASLAAAADALDAE